MCITDGILLQIESARQTNKRKRKAEEVFSDEYDYMYGIVTTGKG